MLLNKAQQGLMSNATQCEIVFSSLDIICPITAEGIYWKA